jgi:signal transduction histidine kinase
MISRSPRSISIVLIFVILLITCATVYSVSMQTRDALKGALQNQLQSVAGIAASGIDGDSFAGIGRGDEGSPAFITVRDDLRRVQRSAPDIRFIYTMRLNGSNVEFVVDGDYGYAPDAAAIGQVYGLTDRELLDGFSKPSFDRDFTTDEWGTVLSGYAPIRDSAGNSVGLVGVDMDSRTVLSRLNFLNIIYYLAGMIAIIAAAVAIIVIERRRIRYENAIEANEAYLNQIFSSVKAGILIVDAGTFSVLDANPLALELIGLPKDLVVGTNLDNLIRPSRCRTPIATHGREQDDTDEKGPDNETTTASLVSHARYMVPQDGQPCNTKGYDQVDIAGDREANGYHEKELLAADGEIIAVIETAVLVTIRGRPRLLETFIDDRERRNAINDLVSLNRKLQILSTITRNDILSELFGLAGFIELLKDDKPDLKGNPILEQLNWVMQRLQAKTRFFRDFEEAGSKGPVWISLQGVIEKAWETQQVSSITIRSDVRGLMVYADPMIERVFFNLFDNTIRHGKGATGISVSWKRDGKDLVIICDDDGTGVPDNQKARIFERGIGSDTGLGLFFAREILAITCIGIRETGIFGRGARFEITVPEGAFRCTDEST